MTTVQKRNILAKYIKDNSNAYYKQSSFEEEPGHRVTVYKTNYGYVEITTMKESRGIVIQIWDRFHHALDFNLRVLDDEIENPDLNEGVKRFIKVMRQLNRQEERDSSFGIYKPRL